MQKKKNPIRTKDIIEYFFFKSFVLLIRITPLFLFKLNQKLLLFIFKRIGKKYHGIVTKNLNIAFPHLNEDKILELKDKVYNHFSTIFIQILALFVRKKPEKVLKPMEVRNLEILEIALQKNSGVIIFSAHLGNWELVPYLLSLHLNRKIWGIAREMNNSLIERTVIRFRESMGSKIIYRRNSIRTIIKAFEQNEIVFFLTDQNAITREGVQIDFFGKRVSAVSSVSALHIKRDIPVVPLFLHYEEERIILEISPEIQFEKTGDTEKDIVTMTRQCTALIEEEIRNYPEQWFWFHNRWKSSPMVNEPRVNQGDPNENRRTDK